MCVFCVVINPGVFCGNNERSLCGFIFTLLRMQKNILPQKNAFSENIFNSLFFSFYLIVKVCYIYSYDRKCGKECHGCNSLHAYSFITGVFETA